ncbi:MAG: alanine racemase [Acidimicrobiales bacterium]|nr:alanine racemase [Acidimicrobiales bacterium]
MTDSSRPTWCDIDLAALERNYSAIKQVVGVSKMMPVIKADAYGHGLTQIGTRLQEIGAPCLAVAYVEEGLALRAAGITVPIQVLGGAVTRQIPLFLEHGLTFTAPSVDKLLQISDAAEAANTTAKVHLKIDTGMERIGVHHYNADTLFEAALSCTSLEVEGVFSHLASADDTDLESARIQLERFLEALDFYDRRSLPTPTRHIANSAAIVALPEAHLDLVRPGLLLYGIEPTDQTSKTITVEPLLSWRSEVIYFKVVEAGSPVSYGGTWAPEHSTRVVTLPVGYADGYRRALSNRAQVLIKGNRHNVVGRVCMDQTMIDIGTASAYNGDQVVLVGSDGNQQITIRDLALWSDTVPYEILTSITARVPRRWHS